MMQNLYALCDFGMPIMKRLAPNQDELQDSSAHVVLPPMLYKPLEKKEENDSLVGKQKTWLADEGILAHFESLELEANGIVHPVISEDEFMKDSETEGSEMPLGKLLERLKAKAAKTVDFDEMDEEPQTSSEYKFMLEKASEVPESELLFSRIRKKLSSSKQKGKRSFEALSNSKEAKKPKKVSNTDKPRLGELLFSPIRKKLSSSKQKGKRSFDRSNSKEAKENGSSSEDLIDRRIKVWGPKKNEYYEGVVMSFDSEKKKHVIFYDDGDMEVLRLEKECWELVDKDLKFEVSGSPKGLSRKGGSSRKGKKTSRGPKQDRNLEKSSSQVRRKRTPRKNQKQRPKKPAISSPEFDPMSSADDSDSEKEENKKTNKNEELSDEVIKQEEDAEDSSDEDEPNKSEEDAEDSSNTDEPKREEKEIEDTESDVF